MLETLITIAVLHWAVLILPGFNFLLIGQLAAAGKRSTALAAVAGMTAGTLMWAILAVMTLVFGWKLYQTEADAARKAAVDVLIVHTT